MGRLTNFRRTLCGGLFLAALTPAAALAADQVGVLECHLSGNGITILVQNQALDCVYEDEATGGNPQHYLGKLTKVGANIGVNGPGDLVWGVVAESRVLGPGALTGDYVGPEASLKVGVGGGGAILVGGSNNTLSLQPFNVEGGEGLGLSAGAESVALTYVPDLPPPPMKHKHHALFWGHLHAAIHHTQEAIDAGKAGHAEGVAHHAEAALHHAEAAENVKVNPHVKEAIGHLRGAIKHGKEGHAEVATKHAEEALEHLEMARK
ncbi:MAG: small metal-binding protein SmbP [Methylocystis sp.]